MLAITKTASRIETGTSPNGVFFVDIIFEGDNVPVGEAAQATFDHIKEAYGLWGSVDHIIALDEARSGWRYTTSNPVDQDKAEQAFRNELI